MDGGEEDAIEIKIKCFISLFQRAAIQARDTFLKLCKNKNTSAYAQSNFRYASVKKSI